MAISGSGVFVPVHSFHGHPRMMEMGPAMLDGRDTEGLSRPRIPCRSIWSSQPSSHVSIEPSCYTPGPVFSVIFPSASSRRAKLCLSPVVLLVSGRCSRLRPRRSKLTRHVTFLSHPAPCSPPSLSASPSPPCPNSAPFLLFLITPSFRSSLSTKRKRVSINSVLATHTSTLPPSHQSTTTFNAISTLRTTATSTQTTKSSVTQYDESLLVIHPPQKVFKLAA